MQDQSDRLAAALSGTYAIQRALGAGGMATVYLARDLKHERDVAVKVLRPDLAAVVGGDRFLREISIAANLQHPHVLPLHDSGEADGFLYYVMPFVKGESLREKLDREGRLSAGETARIVLDVAGALAYAHGQGVVHRDIKPDNIMLSHGHALVADFGVAKGLSEAKSARYLTSAGLAIGTPAYMSPEQAAGDPRIDHRSDIYSLGALTYEMLAGRPPFERSTLQSLMSAHVTEKPVPVRERQPDVPELLDALVMRCLDKDPAKRWQDAAELVPILETLATPSGDLTPTSFKSLLALSGARRSRRPWLIVGLVVSLGVAAAAGIAIVRSRGVAPGPPRVMVLPAAATGDADEDAFADGLTEEISARLGTIRQLQVLGRMTADRYRNSDKSPQVIGQEMDVDYLLHVTVRAQRETRRVRVNAELVNTTTAVQVWSENFLADSVVDLFEAHARIAQEVARELGITLGAAEQRVIAAKLTESAEAYDYYLRGNAAFWRSYTALDAELAAQHYRRATELDPTFAEAFAGLGLAHIEYHWFGGEGADSARLLLARTAIDSAFALAPGLAKGHLARGLYWYHGYLDYDRAMREFDLTIAAQPNDPETVLFRGNVFRRQGNADSAIVNMRRSVELEPGSSLIAHELIQTLNQMGRYDEALEMSERLIDTDPTFSYSYTAKAWSLLFTGDAAGATAAIDQEIAVVGLPRMLADAASVQWWPLLSERGRQEFLALPPAAVGDTVTLFEAQAGLAYAMRLAEAPRLLRAAIAAAEAYLADNAEEEFSLFDLARLKARAAHDSSQVLALARRALALARPQLDRWNGPWHINSLADVHLYLGDTTAAIVTFERAMEAFPAPYRVGYRAWLRTWPLYEGLRRDPRFRRLIARVEGESR